MLLGVSNQYFDHFQKPYSFDTQSELTVEITDATVFLDTDVKPSNLNQVGRTDTDGNNNGISVQDSDSVITSDEQDWHLRGLPVGVKARSVKAS